MKIAFLVFVVLTTLDTIKSRALRASGVCELTGHRLSDAEVVVLARQFAVALQSKLKPTLIDTGGTTVRLVPERELRPEEKPENWVKPSGGYRAYIDIKFDRAPMKPHDGRRIMSNCGKIRTQSFEFKRKFLW